MQGHTKSVVADGGVPKKYDHLKAGSNEITQWGVMLSDVISHLITVAFPQCFFVDCHREENIWY